jgi:Predicted metal-dependent hydrolase of the TIM-barrel fold
MEVTVFMLIDIHAHLWASHYKEDKEELLKAIELYGISKVFVSALGTFIPNGKEIDELNYEVFKFMKEQPEKIDGFCYVNPANKNSLEVLRKGIEQYGMSGMKLWVATFCDDPRVNPLVEKCISYNIPILVHAFHKSNGQLDYESIGRNVAVLAGRYPEAKILMAHLGGNCYDGIKIIKEYKNVWVDISCSIYMREAVDYAIKHLGAERVLFGTDMPGSFLVNYGQIEEADLSNEERELIYYKNALKILDRS